MSNNNLTIPEIRLIRSFLNSDHYKISPLSGGDISKAYEISHKGERMFVKINSDEQANVMFESERKGLEAIGQTGSIRVPKVLGIFEEGRHALMAMEYIESKRPSAQDYFRLGKELFELHQNTAKTFGLSFPNFIGRLPQDNLFSVSWPEFYVHHRLLPQIKLALQHGLLEKEDIPVESVMLKILENCCGQVRPSLLHGDLWGGNFLISTSGTPFLIDPAVYFGHNEVDIAMTKLFGGFAPSFYEGYYQHRIPEKGWEERESIYQLYYLLVHLNLFGASYKGAVIRIFRNYF